MSCVICVHAGVDLRGRMYYYCGLDDKRTCGDCVCHHKPSRFKPVKEGEKFHHIREKKLVVLE